MSAQRKRFLSVAMTISLSLGTVIKSQKISEVLFSARGGNYHTSFFAACLYFDVVKIGSNKLSIFRLKAIIKLENCRNTNMIFLS